MKFSTLVFLFSAVSLTAKEGSNPAITPVDRQDAFWQKRHEQFNEISKQGEAEVVFLGDSITQGWEGKGKVFWDEHFAPLKAANFGISGDRTEHVLWRLANGNFDGLNPKLVVLMIGTNNTGHQGKDGYLCNAEQTAAGVKEILAVLEEKVPQAKVLLLAIFPRGANAEDPMRKQNDATNVLLKEMADGKRVYWKDLAPDFLAENGDLPVEIMPDLLHLSEAGYQRWGEKLLPAVKRLLAAGRQAD
jgi:lysophospholipase L1-like esterase